MNKIKLSMVGLGLLLALSGCSSITAGSIEEESYLSNGDSPEKARGEGNVVAENDNESATTESKSGFSYISAFSADKGRKRSDEDMLAQFSEDSKVTVTADGLLLKDYLHYIFGDLLGVSYILGEGVESDKREITLNLQDAVSQRKVFTISQELLQERGFIVRYADGLFYVHKEKGKGSQADTMFGYGNTPESVPESSLDIMQMVPFNYGSQVSIATLLDRFTNVKALAYPQRDIVMIQGKRREVLRALELVSILDQPIFRNRTIGMYRPTYVSMDIIIETLPSLLEQEGISLTENNNNASISAVKVERLNTVFLFANKKELIDRAVFWANQLDKPSDTIEEQYFIYSPEFSRAIDLGESLELLISDVASLGGSTSAAEQNGNVQGGNARRASVAKNNEVKMVVDERANKLIFKTSGKEYQQLMPLIKRLDIMPQQVALEVIIAEVTLTDKFKQGVEFAFSDGSYSTSTVGALGATGFGGLSYVLTGVQGRLNLNLFQSDSLVNVLSKPSIVVRDGVAAQINVGTDIPVIGETTIDPNDSNSIARTSIEYRKTGVELNVVPTINARGIVTLTIQQSISSQVSDVSTVSGSPPIFERSISTEVIAQDGQTVVLGGLISDNSSKGKTRVPLLSDIPLIGNLFTANSDSGDKTELVVLVTPKIIESTEEWQGLKRQLAEELSHIKLN